MKRVLCLFLFGITLLAENSVWLDIVDLSIDNNGKRIENEDLKDIEDVNVKFRVMDFVNYVEKFLK
ncbi:MAG: hypothetical protein V8S74_04715 [Lachnospirales bacterium]